MSKKDVTKEKLFNLVSVLGLDVGEACDILQISRHDFKTINGDKKIGSQCIFAQGKQIDREKLSKELDIPIEIVNMAYGKFNRRHERIYFEDMHLMICLGYTIGQLAKGLFISNERARQIIYAYGLNDLYKNIEEYIFDGYLSVDGNEDKIKTDINKGLSVHALCKKYNISNKMLKSKFKADIDNRISATEKVSNSIDLITNLYKNGAKIVDIADAIGMSDCTLHAALDNLGIKNETFYKKRRPFNVKDEELKELFELGLGDYDIAKKFDVCPASIYKRRIKLGYYDKDTSKFDTLKYVTLRRLGIQKEDIAKRMDLSINQLDVLIEAKQTNIDTTEAIIEGHLSRKKKQLIAEETGVGLTSIYNCIRRYNELCSRLSNGD